MEEGGTEDVTDPRLRTRKLVLLTGFPGTAEFPLLCPKWTQDVHPKSFSWTKRNNRRVRRRVVVSESLVELWQRKMMKCLKLNFQAVSEQFKHKIYDYIYAAVGIFLAFCSSCRRRIIIYDNPTPTAKRNFGSCQGSWRSLSCCYS